MIKKMALLCLSISSLIASTTKETVTLRKNNHLKNLTCAYTTTAGSQIIFDLDQWSRIGSLAAAYSFAKFFVFDENQSGGANTAYFFLECAALALAFKAGINIIMAAKEFHRNEIARGIEHLSMQHIPFASWYLLASRKSSRDRKIAARLATASGFTVIPLLISYYTIEPFLFIRDCLRGNFPIRYAKNTNPSTTHSNV